MKHANQGLGNQTLMCETCSGDFKSCQGHIGYLKLALPVLNVGHLSIIEEIFTYIDSNADCGGSNQLLSFNDIYCCELIVWIWELDSKL